MRSILASLAILAITSALPSPAPAPAPAPAPTPAPAPAPQVTSIDERNLTCPATFGSNTYASDSIVLVSQKYPNLALGYSINGTAALGKICSIRSIFSIFSYDIHSGSGRTCTVFFVFPKLSIDVLSGAENFLFSGLVLTVDGTPFPETI